MLIIKAYINEKKIEELHIHNTGETIGDFFEYEIVKPEGYEHVEIWHKRFLGYRPLLSRVLKVLEGN